MNITRAKNSGFCFGVKRAIDVAQEAAKSGKVFTLGQLIHNKMVLETLEKKGILVAESIDGIPEDCTVIIRAHGVGPTIYNNLKESGHNFIDATCPKVSKIHEIITEEHNKNRQIVIFGDPKHPETIAHKSWANGNAIVIENTEDIKNTPKDTPLSVIAQTTASLEKWIHIKQEITRHNPDSILFDTICSATSNRQLEAAEVASKVDVMIVIGDSQSSNSKKLFELCKKHCKNTYFIESASQLPMDVLKNSENIGLTAGASTAEWIIEEVTSKMLEEKNAPEVSTEEKSFAQQLEESMVSLYTGEVVKGTVIDVTPTEIIVDLGFKSDGIIPAEELSTNPNTKPSDIAKIGDEISAFVVRVNDMDGNVKLSLRKLEQIANAKKIEAALDDNSIVQGKVTRVVDGGLIVMSGDTRIFVPASHVSNSFVEDLSIMMGKEVDLRIIEIQPRRRKIVGSIKLASGDSRAVKNAEFWENIFIGKKYTGTVKTLTSFGAFIDLGGVDGLVHISELSWSKVAHPEEVLTVGDTIDVYVKGIDLDKHKVSLGYKNPDENPWLKVAKNLNLGDTIKCKIVRIVPFGAFAEIYPGVDGLIHISQLDIKHVTNVQSVVSIGQEVEAKVTAIDLDNEKISLSMAALMEGYTENADTAEPEETKSEDVVDVAAAHSMPENKDAQEVSEIEEISEAEEVSEVQSEE